MRGSICGSEATRLFRSPGVPSPLLSPANPHCSRRAPLSSGPACALLRRASCHPVSDRPRCARQRIRHPVTRWYGAAAEGHGVVLFGWSKHCASLKGRRLGYTFCRPTPWSCLSSVPVPVPPSVCLLSLFPRFLTDAITSSLSQGHLQATKAVDLTLQEQQQPPSAPAASQHAAEPPRGPPPSPSLAQQQQAVMRLSAMGVIHQARALLALHSQPHEERAPNSLTCCHANYWRSE